MDKACLICCRAKTTQPWHFKPVLDYSTLTAEQKHNKTTILWKLSVICETSIKTDFSTFFELSLNDTASQMSNSDHLKADEKHLITWNTLYWSKWTLLVDDINYQQ